MLQHWQLPQLGQLEDPISDFVELVLRHFLGVLCETVDTYLLEEEIGWKGVARGVS